MSTGNARADLGGEPGEIAASLAVSTPYSWETWMEALRLVERHPDAARLFDMARRLSAANGEPPDRIASGLLAMMGRQPINLGPRLRRPKPRTTAEAFAQLQDEVAYLRWLIREHLTVLLGPFAGWLSYAARPAHHPGPPAHRLVRCKFR